MIGFTLHLTSLVLGSQRGAVWEWLSCPYTICALVCQEF